MFYTVKDIKGNYFDLNAAPIVLSRVVWKSPVVNRVSKLDFPAAASPKRTTYEIIVPRTMKIYFDPFRLILWRHFVFVLNAAETPVLYAILIF